MSKGENFGCNLFEQKVPGEEPENPNEVYKKRKYEVWAEGYRATGEQQSAKLLGTVEAISFQEACKELSKTVMVGFWNKDFTTVWGCKVYDNEQDARRNFG